MLQKAHMQLRDCVFDGKLSRMKCSPRQFVAFALRCIKETPVNEERLTPFDLLNSQPELQKAVHVVEAGSASTIQIEKLRDIAYAAALDAVGPSRTKMVGLASACWSVVSLLVALSKLELAEMADVITPAIRAASLARHSGQRLTADALAHQEKLAAELLDSKQLAE